jgi:hypothetical protein
MALVGPDDRGLYRAINVNVTSLRAWSAELHRLAGLTQGVNDALGQWSVNNFVGAGPAGALLLRDLNAAALATLAGAVEQLDGLIARLRDAASYVATSYAGSDAYAEATAESVLAGMRGEVPDA